MRQRLTHSPPPPQFRTTPARRWLLALVAVGLIGCTPSRRPSDDNGGPVGPTGPGNPNDPPGVLTVSLSQNQLTLSGTDQTITLRALSKRYGDVSKLANWSLSDASVGTISGGRLTVSGAVMNGGAYTVTALYRNETGSATLNLRVVLSDVVDNSAPPDAGNYFGGPSGGAAPQFVYPFDNTLLAPNVLQTQLAYQGAGNRVFRIFAQGPTYERNFYVGCTSTQCTYKVDDKIWSGLSHSSLGQDVTLTLSGVVSEGGAVGTSNPITLHFSPEDIRGGLYYFSPTIEGIKRVPLVASAPVDFINHGAETGCAGCHAVSRDGKQVAVEFGSGQTRTGSTVVDGAMPSMRNFPLNPGIAWNFAWFNPTADKLITNWSGTLTIRDPKNGQALSSIPSAQIGSSYGGAMPEWSPDGKWFAFVRIREQSSYDFELINSGDIVIMPYNDGSFGPAVEMVHATPNSEVHFWPTWSPDSQWLVFNTQNCGGGSCDQYNAANTRLRMIRAIDDTGQPTSGAMPIDLLQGTHMPNNSNNWPKFAPFLQGGRYAFVVYSAKYGWGFNNGGLPQLFMFGIDLMKAKTGDDPSFQPAWLPFQDPTTGNHSAIWTTDVACMSDGDCPSEFRCTDGSCTPNFG